MGAWPLSSEAAARLVGQLVTVSVCEGDRVEGWLYTVDPEANSVVVVTSARELVVVPKGAVRGLDVLEGQSDDEQCPVDLAEDSTLIEMLSRHGDDQEDNGNEAGLQVEDRLQQVKDILTHRRMPFVEQQGGQGPELVIANVVHIRPPYTAQACVSTNETVLTRIQRLLPT